MPLAHVANLLFWQPGNRAPAEEQGDIAAQRRLILFGNEEIIAALGQDLAAEHRPRIQGIGCNDTMAQVQTL